MSKFLFDDGRYQVKYFVSIQDSINVVKVSIVDKKHPASHSMIFTKAELMQMMVDLELADTQKDS